MSQFAARTKAPQKGRSKTDSVRLLCAASRSADYRLYTAYCILHTAVQRGRAAPKQGEQQGGTFLASVFCSLLQPLLPPGIRPLAPPIVQLNLSLSFGRATDRERAQKPPGTAADPPPGWQQIK